MWLLTVGVIVTEVAEQREGQSMPLDAVVLGEHNEARLSMVGTVYYDEQAAFLTSTGPVQRNSTVHVGRQAPIVTTTGDTGGTRLGSKDTRPFCREGDQHERT